MTRMAKVERVRIFVGCEGESENGYTVFLANLARDADLPVAVDPHILKKGEPLSRIEQAIAKIEREEEKRGPYAFKFALLDADQRDADPVRATQAIVLAQRHDITITWQEPDHEGLLLHHFDHAEKKHPQTKAQSMAAVKKMWATYEKASTAKQYASKLKPADLVRAAGRHPGLKKMLQKIGLAEEPKEQTAEKPFRFQGPPPKLGLGGDEGA